MPRRSIKLLLRESEDAWKNKRYWQSLLRECYEFALPQQNPYFEGEGDLRHKTSPGQRKTDRLFDSTLMTATTRIANRLQAEITPTGIKWADMKPGDLITDKRLREQANAELHSANSVLFSSLQLSNFSQAINEWYLDLVTAGLAIMAVMEGAEETVPLDFICIPQSTVAVREGPRGKLSDFYRRHRIRKGVIEENWPDFDWPKDLKEVEDHVPVELQEAFYWSGKSQMWYYDVIWAGGPIGGGGASKTPQQGDAVRCVSRQYKNGYWVGTRWLKSPGEDQGRGLVMSALPDAKTLNKTKELLLQNASLAIKGAWLVRHDAVIGQGNVDIHPGAKISVRATGGPTGAAIQRLDVGGDLQLAQLLIADLVNSINTTMLNKALPPETGGVRSATEIVARLREIQQDLGAPLGRVINEGITPMMQIALGVLGQKGLVPLTSDGRAIPLDGARVQFNITSPLIQAQNLQDVENVVNWMTLQRSALGPEAFILGTKVEDVGQYLAEKMNVDPSLVRDLETREQMQALVGMAMSQIGATPANQNEAGGGVAPVGNVPLAA